MPESASVTAGALDGLRLRQRLCAALKVTHLQTDPRFVTNTDRVLHRDELQEIDHPIEGRVRVLGSPVRMSGTPALLRRHPPLLGEHTAEVLAEEVP
jgi:crotonobetainyl-CoA:carnitine CoA-transferase CaiB-like acyl-CoA transferase